ncbi:protein rop [Anaeramoeba flamelloides]|uniref:Protein rop n=1 Tax=Anaeramoeba flamelloides TaxID=1746091 RepID=A0ABQ8YRL9_9EUKA|nr:protein rop [Anaeramoeba flamelloides]
MKRTDFRNTVRNHIIEKMIKKTKQEAGNWIIMVVDKYTLKLLSTTCRMFEILDEGVNLVELITIKRQPLKKIHALYFLSPTKESVQNFLEDFKSKPKYKKAHLFFTHSLPEKLLNSIANSKAKKYIETLVEFNLNFFPIESQVFTFRDKSAFQQIYSIEQTTDQNEVLTRVADQLLTVCTTMGDLPAIRYPKGNQICLGIATYLQNQLTALGKNIKDFPSVDQSEQGVMLILDRSVDLLSPVLHDFYYQSMVYDLLNIEDDKIKYQTETKETKKETESTLDEKDGVWTTYRHLHIAECMTQISSQFNNFIETNSTAKYKKKKGENVNLKMIGQAIKNMPQYHKQIDLFNRHITIASKVMDRFNKDGLQKIGILEQNIVMGEDPEGTPFKDPLVHLQGPLQDNTVDPKNKARLLMLYVITQNPSSKELRKILRLSDLDIDLETSISNLMAIGGNTQSEKKKKKKKKNQVNEEERYEVSRYDPVIQKILKELISGSLPKTKYPYIKSPRKESNLYTRLGSSGKGGKGMSKRSKNSKRGSAMNKWSGKNKNSSKELGKKSDETVQYSGGRVYLFIVGGITYSEMRIAYEISKLFKREVIIGSNHIFKPEEFLEAVKDLKPPEDL